MKILLCGGGTAGHVNPALAIAETIKRNCPDTTFAYVVTENGIENRLSPYKKYVIRVRGLKIFYYFFTFIYSHQSYIYGFNI